MDDQHDQPTTEQVLRELAASQHVTLDDADWNLFLENLTNPPEPTEAFKAAWKEYQVRASIQRGLDQSANGQTQDLGSFAPFASDE